MIAKFSNKREDKRTISKVIHNRSNSNNYRLLLLGLKSKQPSSFKQSLLLVFFTFKKEKT
jgi:hypothetical protein